MQLGGITAWISIGDRKLDEVAVEVLDDHVTCYVEAPTPPHGHSSHHGSDTALQLERVATSRTLPTIGAASGDPTEYTINWRISDLTYSLVVKAVIDGVLDIEKIHLGRAAISTAKNTGKIDAMPVTDDWSKRRLLKFVKLTAAEDAPPLEDNVGSIVLSFYRAGRATLTGGIKTSATGFHTTNPLDVKTLVKETNIDGLYNHSHATGLSPIVFGPPKKVPVVPKRDEHSYVSFEFRYRSHELIAELMPEDWMLPLAAPSPSFEREPEREKDLPRIQRVATKDQSPYGAPLVRRPSLATRAKKWASDVKNTASSVRIVKNDHGGRKVEAISTPRTATEQIENPFLPSTSLSASPSPLAPTSYIPPLTQETASQVEAEVPVQIIDPNHNTDEGTGEEEEIPPPPPAAATKLRHTRKYGSRSHGHGHSASVGGAVGGSGGQGVSGSTRYPDKI